MLHSRKPYSGEIPEWERTVGESRFMARTSELEKDLVLYGHEVASPPTLALDLGCEAGRFSCVLAELGWSLICVEPNADALDVCRQRLPTAQCIHIDTDNRSLHCSDSSMGMLLCIELPVMECAWLADEAVRSLKLGGVLVGTFHNLFSWRGAVSRTPGRDAEQWYHMGYSKWRRAMQGRGFTFLREVGYRWPPFEHTSNSPLLPMALAAEQVLGFNRLVSISPMVGFVIRKDANLVRSSVKPCA